MYMSDGMGTVFLVSALLLGLAVFIGMRGHKKLLESGVIVERRHNFMEYAEYFSLQAITPQQYISALREWGIMEMAEGNVDQLKLRGEGYEAEIMWLEAPEDVSKFCFQFLSWKTRDGSSACMLEQNKLLTRLEKMFLSLDTQTKVTYQKMDVR